MREGVASASETLPELRARIDEVDDQLVELLCARAGLVDRVARVKQRAGLPSYCPAREAEVLRRLISRARGRVDEASLRRFVGEVFSSARARVGELRVAALGPADSMSFLAAQARFGARAHLHGSASFVEILDEVRQGRCELGILPLENSTSGAIGSALAALANARGLHVVEAIETAISWVLVGPPRDLAEGRSAGMRLYGHEQAFAQCRGSLARELPGAERISCPSSSRAAELVARARASGDGGGVYGLCSAAAAARWQLPVLAPSFADSPDNRTRFVLIGAYESEPSSADLSLWRCAGPAETVRALLGLAAAGAFSPSPVQARLLAQEERAPGQLILWCEVPGHHTSPALQAFAPALTRAGVEAHCLGSYPRGAEIPAKARARRLGV